MQELIHIWLIVCPLVFLGGLIDAVAGGGGLITLPAYLLAGLPAHIASGTNKCGNVFGTLLSTGRFLKRGDVHIPSAVAGAAGCAMTYYFYMFPNVGATFQLWGFIAVAMGGFGSIVGAFISGLVMGIADTLTGIYINTAIKYIGVCVVFLVTVSFRPKGIFGK